MGGDELPLGRTTRLNRREVLGAAGVVTLGAGEGLAVASPAKGTGQAVRAYRRIACEEAFTTPEVLAATKRFYARNNPEAQLLAEVLKTYPAPLASSWFEKLLDIGDGRIAHMDATGVDAQLLLLGIHGVQLFDAAEGRELAASVNDRLGEAMRRYPGRFYGLAAFAPQDPVSAAQEIERAVGRLGLKGAVINSHTHGERLDLPKFRPIFEALQAAKVPLYLHPREAAPDALAAYTPYALEGAVWGFAGETGLHALKLIFSGLFDDLPDLKIVLGHSGEGIPFFLDRIDNRSSMEGTGVRGRASLKMKPSDYFRRNFVITTSGMNTLPTVRFCQDALGVENVLFAVDYPYEFNAPAVEAIERTTLNAATRRALFQTNAERVFRL